MKIFLLALLCVLFLVGFSKYRNKLTFLEYTSANEASSEIIGISSPSDTIIQEVKMPYSLFKGISLHIGTYARDNNSDWVISLQSASSGKDIYTWTINANSVIDNGYHFLKTESPISVEKGETYLISISSINAVPATSIAFYRSSNAHSSEEGSLSFNDKVIKGKLDFHIYGGETSLFWAFLYIFYFLFLLVFCLYAFYLDDKGVSVFKDTKILGMLVAIIVFIMLQFFATPAAGEFLDEYDNIVGGLVVSRGGVIYKDFISQHMPFGYFLCAVFALMGASSLEQFRLLFYIVQAIVWGGIFIRHRKNFGAKRLFAIPIILIPLSISVITGIYNSGAMIL